MNKNRTPGNPARRRTLSEMEDYENSELLCNKKLSGYFVSRDRDFDIRDVRRAAGGGF